MTTFPAVREAAADRVCSRRDCLKNVGAAVLGAAAFGTNVRGAPAADARAEDKAQIKLGIAADIYRQLPLEEAVRRIRAEPAEKTAPAAQRAEQRGKEAVRGFAPGQPPPPPGEYL